MSCATSDVREAPPPRAFHNKAPEQGDQPPVAMMPVSLLKHGTSSYARTFRRQWSTSSPDSVVTLEKDQLAKRAPWPTIMVPVDDDDDDDASFVSELSNFDEIHDDDEETFDARIDGSDVDKIPKDSWIIQLIGDGRNESGDTPWIRVLKQGSCGYLMLEGDEVLQLLRAMIKDAASKQLPQPELYTRTLNGLETSRLSAFDALSYFRTLLKSMVALKGWER